MIFLTQRDRASPELYPHIKTANDQPAFQGTSQRRKKANAAVRIIDTIAGRVVRDIERKLTQQQKLKYEKELIIFNSFQ